MIFELQRNMIHQNYGNLGPSTGMGAPRNTPKIRTQCGCEYGCKSYESLVTLTLTLKILLCVITYQIYWNGNVSLKYMPSGSDK